MKKIFMNPDIFKYFKPIAIFVLIIGFVAGIVLAYTIPTTSYETVHSIMNGTRTIENESFNFVLMLVIWFSSILFDAMLCIIYELLKGLYQLKQTAYELLTNIEKNKQEEGDKSEYSSKDAIDRFIHS